MLSCGWVLIENRESHISEWFTISIKKGEDLYFKGMGTGD
jgi:hypothetical protein